MPEAHQNRRSERADEVGLADLWLVLKPHVSWVAACSVVLAAVALVISLTASSVWEASATIQSAFAWQLGQPGPQALEPIGRTAERLRARSFGDAVLRKTGLRTTDRDPEARLFRNSLKVSHPLNTDLIHIVVRAH